MVNTIVTLKNDNVEEEVSAGFKQLVIWKAILTLYNSSLNTHNVVLTSKQRP